MTDSKKNSEKSASHQKNLLNWQIVTLVLPLIFAVAGMVWIYLDPNSRMFVVGMGISLIFGFTLSNLGRIAEASEKRTEEVEVNRESLGLISSKLDEIAAYSAVSRSLADDRLITNANSILGGISLTSEMANRYPSIAPFCKWKISQVEGYVRDLLKQAEDGRVIIDDPARELTSSIELLRASASQEVLAISYEDTPFWTSNEGKRFLEEHKNAIAREVSITRIFIIKSDDGEELLPIMESQSVLGVDVYKISFNDAKDLNPSDVVIYDKSLLRMGFNEDYTKNNMFKAAQLVISQESIRKQLQIFYALLARSEKFEVAQTK